MAQQMHLEHSARIIDLSYVLEDALPSWPGDTQGTPHDDSQADASSGGASLRACVETTIEKDGYFTRTFRMSEHYGTHLDAPAHFIANAKTVDQIPIERLFGPGVVLDVRDAVGSDSADPRVDYELAPDMIARWESAYGLIPPGSIVLLRTGWASRWPDATRYCNRDAAGTMRFPGFGVAAVRALIDRGVSGIGTDTMSVDSGRSPDYPVHRLALGAGRYHLENLADMSALPEAGAQLLVAPLKLKGGSGAPCRVFAFLP